MLFSKASTILSFFPQEVEALPLALRIAPSTLKATADKYLQYNAVYC